MNDNKTEEIKEPVKSSKDLQKEKWKKFVFGDTKDKKDKIPLDKQDKLCYAGSIFFFFLAFVPTLLRLFDPTYQEGGRIEEEKVKVVDVYKNISCTKEDANSQLTILSSYKNNKVQETTYKFLFSSGNELSNDEIVLPEEYNTISAIDSPGITINKENNDYSIIINYNLDESLRTNQLLDSHNNMLSIQIQTYQDAGYTCTILEAK